MCASKVPVNVHMPRAQKEGIKRLADGLGVTPSTYARIAVEVALAKPGMDSVVAKMLHAKAPDKDLDEQFRFALGRPQHRELRGRADALGVTMAPYLRAVLSIPCVPAKGDGGGGGDVVSFVDSAAVRRELREIKTDLARIGNNLNQIARGINVMSKKNWLSAREAESLFTFWRESTGRAQADLDGIGDAVDECLSILREAGDGFAIVGEEPRCRK